MRKIIEICMCLIALVEAFVLGGISTICLVRNALWLIPKDTEKRKDYDDCKNKYRHY